MIGHWGYPGIAGPREEVGLLLLTMRMRIQDHRDPHRSSAIAAPPIHLRVSHDQLLPLGDGQASVTASETMR